MALQPEAQLTRPRHPRLDTEHVDDVHRVWLFLRNEMRGDAEGRVDGEVLVARESRTRDMQGVLDAHGSLGPAATRDVRNDQRSEPQHALMLFRITVQRDGGRNRRAVHRY